MQSLIYCHGLIPNNRFIIPLFAIGFFFFFKAIKYKALFWCRCIKQLCLWKVLLSSLLFKILEDPLRQKTNYWKWFMAQWVRASFSLYFCVDGRKCKCLKKKKTVRNALPGVTPSLMINTLESSLLRDVLVLNPCRGEQQTLLTTVCLFS